MTPLQGFREAAESGVSSCTHAKLACPEATGGHTVKIDSIQSDCCRCHGMMRQQVGELQPRSPENRVVSPADAERGTQRARRQVGRSSWTRCRLAVQRSGERPAGPGQGPGRAGRTQTPYRPVEALEACRRRPGAGTQSERISTTARFSRLPAPPGAIGRSPVAGLAR